MYPNMEINYHFYDVFLLRSVLRILIWKIWSPLLYVLSNVFFIRESLFELCKNRYPSAVSLYCDMLSSLLFLWLNHYFTFIYCVFIDSIYKIRCLKAVCIIIIWLELQSVYECIHTKPGPYLQLITFYRPGFVYFLLVVFSAFFPSNILLVVTSTFKLYIKMFVVILFYL